MGTLSASRALSMACDFMLHVLNSDFVLTVIDQVTLHADSDGLGDTIRQPKVNTICMHIGIKILSTEVI
jgi:hypothetical protein